MYRREADGAKRRLKIGEYPIFSLAKARATALAALSQVESGGDPAGEKQEAKGELTVAELAKLYLDRILAEFSLRQAERSPSQPFAQESQ